MKKKKMWTGLMAAVFLCILGAGGGIDVFAGNLDSPGDPATAGRMYTIKNIYDYLTDVDNAPPTKPAGGFAGPATGPTAGTMHTLDDVFASLTRCSATGQATCYKFTTVWETDTGCASTEGQDAEYKKGATLRYHTYTTDTNVVIVDENTGLEWEQKTVGNKDTTYIWYDSTKTGDERYAAAYYCEHQIGTSGTYAGHSDWRLPNVKELQSIVNYGNRSPAIGEATVGGSGTGAPFLNTISNAYWSSTTFDSNTGYAWSVYFSYGWVDSLGKTNGVYLRCVR